jgi:hypothetical protein
MIIDQGKSAHSMLNANEGRQFQRRLGRAKRGAGKVMICGEAVHREKDRPKGN